MPPTSYKTGSKFKNKSEEARFLKQFDPVIKLKHILLTDTDKVKTYTRQVLEMFFTKDEVDGFTELGILNF